MLVEFDAISWLAVLIATIAFFAIGGVYYGPLFSKTWMSAAGMTEEDASRSNLPLVFLGTLVLEAVAMAGLAAVIGDDATVASGAWAGLVVGLLIVATALGVNALYERRSATLWALNAGYNILGFLAGGAIIGWLQ